MAIIYLTKGYETKVDDDLYDDLNSYLWHESAGRPARRLRAGPRKVIFMYHQILHVLPWVISKMRLCVDHIDGDPLNNTKANLRLCSQKDNMRNTLLYGHRQGISYDTTHEAYKVYIDRPDQPRINVGTYKNEEYAKIALARAKMELGLENN